MRRTWARILLTLLSIFILIGVALTFYFIFNPRRSRVIELVVGADGGSETVSFEDLSLVPGSRSEYIIRLRSETEDHYAVSLDFSGSVSDGFRGNLTVEIECDGLDGDRTFLLYELLLGKEILIYDKITPDEAYEIRITYYLPESVGNEAQNSEANFDLTITARNDGGFYE